MKNRKAKTSSPQRRLALLSWGVVASTAINFIVYFFTNADELFIQWNNCTGVVAAMILFRDYKLMAVGGLYLRGLFSAMAFLGFSVYLNTFSNKSLDVMPVYSGPLLIVSLFIVQFPLRQLYLLMFHREPKVEQLGLFADLVYLLALFIGSILGTLCTVQYVEG